MVHRISCKTVLRKKSNRDSPFATLAKIAKSPKLLAKAKEHYDLILKNRGLVAVGNGIDCWRPMQKTDPLRPLGGNPSGYIQRVIYNPKKPDPSIDKVQVTAYIHHLGWLRKINFDPKKVLAIRDKVIGNLETLTVSHLCDNPWCFRPRHLTIEPLTQNIMRCTCKSKDLTNPQECACGEVKCISRDWTLKYL